MKKGLLIVALTLMCLFVSDTRSLAQDSDGVVVKIPFDFVAAGKTMPAGTYTVDRISSDSHSGLVIRGENEGVLLLPVVVGGPSARQPSASFDRQGDRYILSSLSTPGGMYNIVLPPAIAMQARGKDHGNVAFPGAN